MNDLVTPQSRAASPKQAPNSAGGYSFTLDSWARLDRFLVLGSVGGTYYVGERKLTEDCAAAIKDCLSQDGLRTVRRIVEVSDAGRAPKNDPAIFALALCCGAKDPAVRAAALGAIPAVCRIGTHLFHFAPDVEGFRRWGRGLKRAVQKWYTTRPADKLALQLAKYQQRDGWGHRDLLRLSHPVPPTPAHRAAFAWATGGMAALDTGEQRDGEARNEAGNATSMRGAPGSKQYIKPLASSLPALLQAFERIHDPGTSLREAVALIREHELPHECVPNEIKDKPEVWAALLDGMGITSVIRNLGKMTAVGLLTPMGDATRKMVALLTDGAGLYKGRVHPLAVLLALKTYESGRGIKGSLTWQPVREIVDALDACFYLCFSAIEPTAKRTLLALDVSGSMTWSTIAGTPITPRVGSAAMAMVTARTEQHWHAMAFSSGLQPLSISPKQRLDDVVRTIERMGAGGTDCSLPMLYAMGAKIPVDAFYVYTDNETWAGSVHPHQALVQYRQAMGIPAKLVVVGMTATGFTIADPDDAGMLDVVGFDAAAPAIVADFVAAREVSR